MKASMSLAALGLVVLLSYSVGPDAGRPLGKLQDAATALPKNLKISGGEHTHHIVGVMTWGDSSSFDPDPNTFRNYNAQSGGGAFGNGLSRGTGIPSSGAHSHALAGGDGETRPVNQALIGFIKT